MSDARVSFFHASFFDYAFARGFVSRGQNLVDWLATDGQDLFRRSQVRQVLEFLREDGANVYSWDVNAPIARRLLSAST